VVSPWRQAPRPLMKTSLLPLDIVCELQCGTLRSPRLAAAGMFSLHKFPESILPLIDLLVLCCGVWWRRDLGLEFDHMIDMHRYVVEIAKFLQLTTYHYHESMRHLSCNDLPCGRSYASGSFDPAVPHIIAGLGHQHPAVII
jgi:hypothetical protein